MVFFSSMISFFHYSRCSLVNISFLDGVPLLDQKMAMDVVAPPPMLIFLLSTSFILASSLINHPTMVLMVRSTLITLSQND